MPRTLAPVAAAHVNTFTEARAKERHIVNVKEPIAERQTKRDCPDMMETTVTTKDEATAGTELTTSSKRLTHQPMSDHRKANSLFAEGAAAPALA